MLNGTALAKRLLIAFGSTGVWLSSPAAAQQPAVQQLQRVEVTGSNIRRSQIETASPVQTLGREEIERSGKTSVAELLQTLTVDNQGSVPIRFGAGFAAGAAGISLRGLGVASTLVLVNGRRIAPYALADDGQKVFADLNMIPLEAVERVEILKDGASAIYGSDAVAGVVNIILRKHFDGTVGSVSIGRSRYGDGTEKRASITTGFGNLDRDRYNVLLNLELAKTDQMYYRDRAGRDHIGRADLRDYGFSAQEALGGAGAITRNNNADNSINGNVRQPGTNDYYNRGSTDPRAGFTRAQPGAACSNFTNHPQGDPGYNLNVGAGGAPQQPFIQSGTGCLIDDAQRYQQVQPSQESVNFFGRGSLQLSGDLQAYAELNLYRNKVESSDTPSVMNTNVGFPGGPVSNAAVSLGAAHPDNPFFGAPARLRYLADDVGPRVTNVESTFTRFVAGIKGRVDAWDFDSALLFSRSKLSREFTGFLQRDVTFALLNPTAANVADATANSPAYAALPAGSLWRIAENAGLNSRALYAALSPAISSDGASQITQLDVRAARDIGTLPGGPIGLALGAEVRHESLRLDPTTGTDRGNIIGIGYSAYDGSRNVFATYAEVLAPVTKTVELNAALRFDHYSDVGNSVTPKVGAKWVPIPEFAIRGTYAEGFRAPGAAENGRGGLAFFSVSTDPARCDLGVTAACNPAPVAGIVSPNPDLEPEKSKSYTVGFVWAPTPRSNVSIDFWQIDRTNQINQETIGSALAAGRVARDPSTATAIPGDPGAITAILIGYENSARTTIRGLDLDANHSFDLGANRGRLTLGAAWTHLFRWLREDKDGSKFDYAGTHGDCNFTNCVGTPADRVNLGATWQTGGLKVSALMNYRASIANRLFRNDPAGCASHFADGSDAPGGCRIASFTTVDVNLRWQATNKLEVFGGVQNLFDRVAPLDPLTYGAAAYNPLDYSGAVGRYYRAGLRYRF